jgi:hypothetical protein
MQYIELSQGKRAMVDDEDYEWLSQWKWSLFHNKNRAGNGYAVRNIYEGGRVKERIYMHRAITNAQPGQEVDHADRDGINNQRANLRIATRQENSRNTTKKVQRDLTSQYKGVSRKNKNWGWLAGITTDEGYVGLGTYQTERMAAIAYDRAALQYHGEFASLNFPDRPDDVLVKSDGKSQSRRLAAVRNRPGPGWLTGQEAVKALGVSKQRISQMAQEGKLFTTSVGKYVYVSAKSLQRYQPTSQPDMFKTA